MLGLLERWCSGWDWRYLKVGRGVCGETRCDASLDVVSESLFVTARVYCDLMEDWSSKLWENWTVVVWRFAMVASFYVI